MSLLARAGLILVSLMGLIALAGQLWQLNLWAEYARYVRAGVPVKEWDALNLNPTKLGKVTYQAQELDAFLVRSSGLGPLRGGDFLLLSDSRGLIVVVVSLDSQYGREAARSFNLEGL